VETSEKILQGAEELFMRYGVKSITMDEIAKHLGISKKTIYQFFPDKDEIVFLMCKKGIEEDVCCMKEIQMKSSSAIEEMLRISEFLRKELVSMHPSLLFDLHKYHRRAWNVYMAHKESVMEKSVSSNLQRGIEEGCYRPEINVLILAKLRLETIQIAFDPTVFPPEEYNFGEIHAQFIEHFVRGLLTPKGLELWEKGKGMLEANKAISSLGAVCTLIFSSLLVLV
jgi:AcrR family transcriptional regulator